MCSVCPSAASPCASVSARPLPTPPTSPTSCLWSLRPLPNLLDICSVGETGRRRASSSPRLFRLTSTSVVSRETAAHCCTSGDCCIHRQTPPRVHAQQFDQTTILPFRSPSSSRQERRLTCLTWLTSTICPVSASVPDDKRHTTRTTRPSAHSKPHY